jgi:hypothetical protein
MGRSHITSAGKFFMLSFLLVLFMTVNQRVVRADTVEFHGTTMGAFNSPPFSLHPTLFGLTHDSPSFPNLIATLDSGVPSLTLAGSSVNLGTFTLTGDPATYTGNTFFLQLNLGFLTPSFPLSIETTPIPSFTAALIGSVQNASDGSLLIDFDNTPAIFSVLMDGKLVGTFSIVVNDITIKPGETVNVVGTASQVPEPATLVMLATGLVGIGNAMRKRRKR